MRERFAAAARERQEDLRRLFNSEAMDSLILSTAEPWLGALLAFFERREHGHP